MLIFSIDRSTPPLPIQFNLGFGSFKLQLRSFIHSETSVELLIGYLVAFKQLMRVNRLLGKQWRKHNKTHRAWWPPAMYSLSAKVIWFYCSLATKLKGVTLFMRWTSIHLSCRDKNKIWNSYRSNFLYQFLVSQKELIWGLNSVL